MIFGKKKKGEKKDARNSQELTTQIIPQTQQNKMRKEKIERELTQ